MEEQITHLCGGYYRSFARFKRQVEKMEDSRRFIEECAHFLTNNPDTAGDELKERFTRLFFKAYGKMLAGDCGCSNLVYDFQRIRVVEQDFFLDMMRAAVEIGILDCSHDELAVVLYAGYRTRFALKTIKNRLITETSGGKILQEALERIFGRYYSASKSHK